MMARRRLSASPTSGSTTGLVAIGKGPGGVEIVARPIEDTMREVDQMLDGLIRMGRH